MKSKIALSTITLLFLIACSEHPASKADEAPDKEKNQTEWVANESTGLLEKRTYNDQNGLIKLAIFSEDSSLLQQQTYNSMGLDSIYIYNNGGNVVKMSMQNDSTP